MQGELRTPPDISGLVERVREFGDAVQAAADALESVKMPFVADSAWLPFPGLRRRLRHD